MDINIQEQQGLDAVLSVKVAPEDYEPGIEQNINTYRKDLKLPGFRPGKVPKGIVRKMLLEQMKREQVEKAVQEGVKNFFTDKDMDLLMNPLLKTEDSTIDWKADTNFEFTYEIGIRPKVDLNLEALQGVTLHKVQVEDKDIDEQIDLMQQREGSIQDYSEVPDQDDAKVYIEFNELDEEKEVLEGGVEKKKVYDLKDFNDKFRQELVGKKAKEPFTLNLNDFLNTEELEKVLEIDANTAQDLGDAFQLQLVDIYTSKPAALNEDFYKKIFPDKEITDEAAFREEVKELTQRYFQRESQHQARHRIKDELLKNTTIELPENFLSNWVKRNATDKEMEPESEEFEKQFKRFREDMKWSLIADIISTEQEISVENSEIRDFANQMIRGQFAQYGIGAGSEELLNRYLQDYLSKQENVSNIASSIRDQKVLDYLEQKTDFQEEDITLEKFREIEHHHHD